MRILTRTNNDLISLGILFVRIIVGLIFFVGGAGKALGWFHGMGMEATLTAFKTGSGISAFWAYVSTYTEFIAGFLLIIGFLTRPAALALAINMLVAVILLGTKNFFLGGGAYPFSLMISCILVLLTGPMRFSVDWWMSGKR